MATPTEIVIADVAWPLYKLLALLLGVVTLLVTAVATSTLSVAVLSAAGLATVVWVAGSLARSTGR